jgi:hypothetical protein
MPLTSIISSNKARLNNSQKKPTTDNVAKITPTIADTIKNLYLVSGIFQKLNEPSSRSTALIKNF